MFNNSRGVCPEGVVLKRLVNFGDERNQNFCVHCGGAYETEDHVPPKLWLDDPFPENLAFSPSCQKCNKAYAGDEAYLACLLECAIAGSSDPAKFRRPKVAKLLASNFRLTEIMNSASRMSNSEVVWNVEADRVNRALQKLARCHAAYELNEPRIDEPISVWWMPLLLMTSAQMEQFENPPLPAVWPEVGSREMSRLVVTDEGYENGWVEVQPGNYRFMALFEGSLRIRMVLREYLASEVQW